MSASGAANGCRANSLPCNLTGFAQHVLYLSATPIPRSLTLALYGDMEVRLPGYPRPDRPKGSVYICPELWRWHVLLLQADCWVVSARAYFAAASDCLLRAGRRAVSTPFTAYVVGLIFVCESYGSTRPMPRQAGRPRDWTGMRD